MMVKFIFINFFIWKTAECATFLFAGFILIWVNNWRHKPQTDQMIGCLAVKWKKKYAATKKPNVILYSYANKVMGQQRNYKGNINMGPPIVKRSTYVLWASTTERMIKTREGPSPMSNNGWVWVSFDSVFKGTILLAPWSAWFHKSIIDVIIYFKLIRIMLLSKIVAKINASKMPFAQQMTCMQQKVPRELLKRSCPREQYFHKK